MSDENEQKEDFSTLYRQLIEVRDSSNSLDALGEVIAQFPRLFVLPPSPNLLQHLEESQAQKGVPRDKMWFPEVHGTFVGNGYAPALFTTVEFAQHIAKINGHIPEGSAILIQSTTTHYMLMARLVAGAAGVIIDGGQPHKVCLNAGQLSRVAAIANRGNFATIPDLITLRNKNGAPIFDTQGVTQILVYDESVNSQAIREFLATNFGINEVTFSQESTAAVLRDGLAAGAQQLTVNLGLVSCRVYSEADLNIMSKV